VFRLARTSILANKLRFGLTAGVIVFGVTCVVATFVLTDSLRSTFGDLAGDIESGIDLTVRSELPFGESFNRKPVDEALLPPLLDVPGVAGAEPRVISNNVFVIDDTGSAIDPSPAPAFGINAFEAQLFIAEGRLPQGGGEFAADADLAADGGLTIGSDYAIQGPIGRQEFTLVGIVNFASEVENRAVGATLAVFDTPTAQTFLDNVGTYDEVAVFLEDGADPAEVAGAIAAGLPAGVEVVDPEVKIAEQEDGFDQFISIFGNVLLGFALIIVFVAAFLIFNTFSIILGQRIRELGLLRALGATRGQIVTALVLEALLLGIVATAIGLGLGVLGGVGLRGALNGAGFSLPDGPVQVRTPTVVWAVVVGVVFTLLASLVPAFRSRHIPPIAALANDSRLPQRSLTLRLIAGGGVTGLGAVLLALGFFGGLDTAPLLASIASGAILVFVGITMLAPLFARPVADLLGRTWLAAVLLLFFAAVGTLLLVQLIEAADDGSVGRAVTRGVSLAAVALTGVAIWRVLPDRLLHQLGRRNASRSPRRTGTTAGSIMIGLSLIAMTAVVGQSVKQSFLDTLDNAVTADFFVRSSGGFDPTAGFSAELADDLSTLAEAGDVVRYRFALEAIEVEGSVKNVFATDLAAVERHIDPDVQDGAIATADPLTSILVAEQPAKDLGVGVGDTLTVRFQDGATERLTVAAVYADPTILDNWSIDLRLWDRHIPSRADQFVTINAADGVAPDAARTAIDGVAAGYPSVKVEDRVEFKASQQAQLDSVLAIIRTFLFIAVLVAVLGVGNTLSLSVVERTREIGLTRAVGMTRSQLQRTIRWEALIIAVFGGLLGIALGVVFGTAAVLAIPDTVVDTVAFPVRELLTYLVPAVVFTVLASWFPARRAARMDVLDAIASE
jgi:putative ABC transport system permease protein